MSCREHNGSTIDVSMKNLTIARPLVFIATALLLLLPACKHPEIITDYPQLVLDVRMEDVTFKSKALNREMHYRVFLPEFLSPNKKLPVVYLLDGGGGNFRSWSNYTNVSEYALKGLILVMPQGDNSYYMNSVEAPDEKFEDYMTQDLIADVESRFPAKSGRENRAIIGVSMGGFGAVDYAFVHPDLYSFVGAISPAVDVPSRRFTLRRYDQWLRFRHIFGPMDSPERDTRDPFKLVEKANPQTTPYIYITAGEQESMFDPIKRFANRLKARGFQSEFHTKPGGHDWQEWNQQLPGCMDSLAGRMK
jgi:putative tributyrin esterase